MNSADTHKQIPTIIESGSDAFEVLSVLGQGGMGIVYKARQKNLNRIVAIKMLRIGPVSDRTTLHRLQIEAKAAAKVDHPNVVKVYSFGMLNEQPFIIMEYVEGRTLAEILSEQKKLTVAEVYNYFGQALQALRCIHNAGFLHRDIKPSNLMVTTDGTIKLMDFGIAKEINAIAGQSVTQTSAMLGSPHYMSPEQCAGSPLDVRTDIYSLGCSVYEALAGHQPFAGENSLEVMFKHLHQQADTLSGTIDPMLADVVAKALSKQREDRFQSATEFLDALNACQGGDYVPTRKKTRARLSILSSPKTRILIPVAAVVLVVTLLMPMLQPKPSITDLEKDGERDSSTKGTERAMEERVAIDLDSQTETFEVSREKYIKNARALENALVRAKEERSLDCEVKALRELAATTSRFDADRAEKLYMQALELADKAYDDTTDQVDEHIITYKMALHFCREKVRVQQFRSLYKRALKIANFQKSLDGTTTSPALITISTLVAEDHFLAINLNQYKRAEKLARDAMELCRQAQVDAKTSAELSYDWLLLGDALKRQSRWQEVEQEMERAIQHTEQGTDNMTDTRRWLFHQCLLAAEASYHLRNEQKCKQFFNKAMPIAEELGQHDELIVPKDALANALFNHASQLNSFGDGKSAFALSLKATNLARNDSGKVTTPTGLDYLMLSTNLAHSRNDRSTFKLAQETEELAKQLRDAREGEATLLTGSSSYLSGNYKEAEKRLSKAREFLAQSNSKDNRLNFNVARYSGLTAVKLQKHEEAATWFKTAKTFFDADKNVLLPEFHSLFASEYKAITRNTP